MKEVKSCNDIFNEDELKIKNHEANLLVFIETAIGLPIDVIYSTVKKEHEFSILLENHVILSLNYLEGFKKGLRNELSNSANMKIYEIDIKHRFLPLINNYKKWYSENNTETEKFNPYNPYELMHGIIINTEREIFKYWPPKPATKDEKPETNPEYTKLSEAFEIPSKYHKIMKLLANNGYCEQNTFVWSEDKANKGTLIFLLKELHNKLYFKDKRKLKNTEIINIALNTFGVVISESYVKQYKMDDPALKKIIPIASTLF